MKNKKNQLKTFRNNLKLLEIIKTSWKKINVSSVGLCSIALWCKREGRITLEEHTRIMKLLKAHKPKGIPVTEHWFHYDGIERDKFINKLIKKYS